LTWHDGRHTIAVVRYPTDHKPATRERILAAAGAAFRRRGVAGTGIDGVMAAAGLTAGGFYAHFPSKAALLAAVVERLLPRGADLLSAGLDEERGHAFLRAAAARYLGPEHRDAPEAGCPLPALLSDLPRAGDAPRRALADGLLRMAADLGPRMPAAPGLNGEDRVLATLALGAGGVALARAVPDPDLADRILAACRALAALDDPRGAAGGDHRQAAPAGYGVAR
jgi:TetR/AcrR family transcriptional regulator, transcriptional repressor for nem operon